MRTTTVLALITAAVLALAFALAPTAQAQSMPGGPDWEAAPLYTGPGWAESYDAELDYWAQVPEVSWTDAQGTHVVHPAELVASLRGPVEDRQVCKGGITYHLLNTDILPLANAWGRTSDDEHPDCKIWIEQRFVDATEAKGPGERERERCAAGVHEMGHALGIPHGNYSDPLNIMGAWPGQLYPQPCLARWPMPAPLTEAETEAKADRDLITQVDSEYRGKTVSKAAAKALIVKKLGRGWRIHAEVSNSVINLDKTVYVTEVTVAARRVCKTKRCNHSIRRYVMKNHNGAILVRRAR